MLDAAHAVRLTKSRMHRMASSAGWGARGAACIEAVSSGSRVTTMRNRVSCCACVRGWMHMHVHEMREREWE